MDTFTVILLSLCIFACLTNAQILTISADNVTVPYNTTASLECSVLVNTTDQVNLTFNEFQRSPPLDRATLNYTVVQDDDDDVHVLILQLDNVLLSDEGLFTCLATVMADNYTETKTTLFTLAVSDYYDLILSINASNVTVMYNSPANLRCAVEANETAISNTGSEVTISIQKIGNTFPISDHTEEDDSMFSKTIKISNAQNEDSSLYQCTVCIGEEKRTTHFWLIVLNETPSAVPSPSPSESPTDDQSDDSFDQQLLFIIILSAVITVTVIILFAITCYFFAGNIDIICYNKDKLRMNRMERKMNRRKRNRNSTSLYDQELAYNDAYDVDLDEEEIEETVDDTQWDDDYQEEQERSQKRIRSTKRKGSFNMPTRKDSMAINHKRLGNVMWKPRGDDTSDDEDDYSSDEEEQQERQRQIDLQQWPTIDMQHETASSQTVDTEIFDEYNLMTDSDEDESSDEDSDVSVDNFPVPDVVFKPDKTRKSSLKLPLQKQKKPGMKKRVSMGSVEILDDEGEKIFSRRVEFNDATERDERPPIAAEQKDIHPKKHESKKMDDVMNNVGKAQRDSITDDEKQQAVSPPNENPTKMSQLPTPFPSKEEEGNAFAFPSNEEVTTDIPIFHEKEKGGFFGKWSRSSSTSKGSKKESKATKTSLKEESKATKTSLKEEAKATKTSLKEEAKATKTSLKEEAKAAKISLKEEAKAAKISLKEEAKATKTSLKNESKATKTSLKNEAKATKTSVKKSDKKIVSSSYNSADVFY